VTVDSENVAPLVRVRGHAHVELFADRLAETAHELTDVGARQRVASRTRVDARVPEGLGGQTPESMPMNPMKAEQCVCEGLKALQANRPMIIPGRLNRIMNAIIPAFITRAMMAKMFTKALANKSAAPHPQAEMR
jgi:hypothetical protein